MHRCAHSLATALLLVSMLAACARPPAESSPALPADRASPQAARRASQAPASPSSQPAPSETPPSLALPPAPTPVPKGAALYTAVPIPEEDAALLAKAVNDIPRYRQGDLVLSVVDADGKPLAGYRVRYQQVSHDLWFAIRGYAGDYELTVVDPESGAATKGRAHIREQQAQTTTLVFAGDAELAALRTKLEGLVAYWEARPDAALAQRGRDSLALAADQLGRGDRDSAQRTLLAGLADLRATETIHFSASELHAKGQACPGPILENGRIVMWQSQALCYPLDLPPGLLRVDVTARGTRAPSGCQGEEVGGVWPTMVIGVGAHYSKRMAVDSDRSAVYSATLPLTGDERVLTIRDLWSGCGDAGEWKLYVEDVTLTVQTEEPQS